VLQGPDGMDSAAADAEMLTLIATSHFEAVEVGYEKLLARVKTSAGSIRRTSRSPRRQHGQPFAAGPRQHTGATPSSRRQRRRLSLACFALATVMSGHARLRETDAASAERDPVEALVNGLSSIRGHSSARRSASKAAADGRRSRSRDLPRRFSYRNSKSTVRDAVLPLAFFFNSRTTLKGTVVDAAARKAWDACSTIC
jgi:hypothetical protein